MKVAGAIGLLILLAGVIMGLAQGFITYFPYSLYYGLVVVVLVGLGLYAIHREGKQKD